MKDDLEIFRDRLLSDSKVLADLTSEFDWKEIINEPLVNSDIIIVVKYFYRKPTLVNFKTACKILDVLNKYEFIGFEEYLIFTWIKFERLNVRPISNDYITDLLTPFVDQSFYGNERIDVYFILACSKGYLNLIQWLYQEYHHFISLDIDSGFMEAISANQIQVAKYLYQHFKDQINLYDTDLVYYAALSRSTDSLLYLKTLTSTDYVDEQLNNLFGKFLTDDKLELAEYIYSLNSNIDLNLEFKFAVMDGNFEMSKFIYNLNPESLTLDNWQESIRYVDAESDAKLYAWLIDHKPLV